nr:MAG TPA: hypothetical protein [Caudoviricetes sp.]
MSFTTAPPLRYPKRGSASRQRFNTTQLNSQCHRHVIHYRAAASLP